MAILVTEEQSVGEHVFEFGAKGIGYAAGIYMVRLTVNGDIYTKRIFELK